MLHQGFLLDERSLLAHTRVDRRRIGAEGFVSSASKSVFRCLVGAQSCPVGAHKCSECSSLAHKSVKFGAPGSSVPCLRTSVLFISAQACLQSAHKSAHCWRTRVRAVGAQACPLSGHECVVSAQVGLLSAHTSFPCWSTSRRTQVFMVGARACSPLAHTSVPCSRTRRFAFKIVPRLAHTRGDCRRISVRAIGA